jgi:hypothetical protein
MTPEEAQQHAIKIFEHLVNLDVFTADFGGEEPDADTLEKYREACEMIAGVIIDSLELEIPADQTLAEEDGQLVVLITPKDEIDLGDWLLDYTQAPEVAENLD